jgi:hypothetical protein
VQIDLASSNGFAATGSITLTSGSYTSAPAALDLGNTAITIPAGALALGTDTLTATYTPDAESSPVFYSATGTTTVTVSPPSFTISGASVILTPGATSGNFAIINVMPTLGFTGSVTLSATVTANSTSAQDLPTASFGSTSPVSVDGLNAGTATLTITTTAPTSATLITPRHSGAPWYEAGGATLACLLLFGVSGRRRSWRTMLGMLALLMALAGGAVSCGGSGSVSGGGGTGGSSGTTPGTYTITVTGTSGTITQTGTVSLTVQ